MFSSFWIGDKPQKPQNGRHVLWPFPYELISRVFALSFWLYVSTNIWQENIIPFSLHLEPNIRWRSESLPLASAPPSRHLRECDICTCPFSIWAPIHHHGLLFLFPNFVPQATKCAWFSLLHNLALWPVLALCLSEPIYLLKTEANWTTWSLRVPPSLISWPNYIDTYNTDDASVWFGKIQEPGVVVRCSKFRSSLSRSRKTELATLLIFYDGK